MSTLSANHSHLSSLDFEKEENSDFSVSEDLSDDDIALKESIKKKISANKKRARFLEKSRVSKTRHDV